MNKPYFSDLIPELATRASRSVVSRLGFSNKPLRLFLSKLFSAALGEQGCFLGEPVFEATFGWQEATETLHDLVKSGLLTKELVKALDEAKAQSLPKTTHPYRHQLESWQRLSSNNPTSVVVTSGTGSGKTECFFIPILDALVRRQQEEQKQLVGVEALFLYPLNALIQSQRERLNAWTTAFDGKIRYCLYNGNTPEKKPQHERNNSPNEVIDREMLRVSPPPILVTNSTMLEYMLVRAQDAPIIEKSKGKLKWIVLDEAHTYIGSQAAEMALLLRRVMYAFEVKPEEVRFVATSATIGGGQEAKAQLQKFLAEISGQQLEQVLVISGERHIPDLRKGDAHQYGQADLEQLEALPEGDRYAALCGNATARNIRELFRRSQALPLSDIHRALAATASQRDALRWLDLLTSPRHPSFLPLRVHLFHTVLEGLWACADPACKAKKGTALDDGQWQFGKVYTEPRKHCQCGAPVYELRSCNDCNTIYLWALDVTVDATRRLVQTQDVDTDEFTLDVESTEEEDAPESAGPTDANSENVLIANAHPHPRKTSEKSIDCATLEMEPQQSQRTVTVRLRSADSNDRLTCPECDASHGNPHETFRSARIGAPFLLSQIIPTLFEFCPDFEDRPLAHPLRGRRMISFTDSRQGTARLAVRLQQESERNRIRGLIYQHVLTAGQAEADEETKKLEEELTTLKAVVERAPQLAKMVAEKEKRLAELKAPKPISFEKLVGWLVASAADVRDWMSEYYQELDPHVYKTNHGKEELARMLVAREFARRPKRQNNLETMGLVRTHYPKLDKIEAPKFTQSGVPNIDLADWQDFLKICLDFHVRGNAVLDLKENWKKTFGVKFFSKQLLPPDSTEQPTPRLKLWPQCNNITRSRLVRLLAYAFKLDPSSPMERDAINTILRTAWETLVRVELLKRGDQGRYLALEDMAFTPITTAWVCPVTQRILDVTFCGITPYLPILPKDFPLHEPPPGITKCRPITIPLCDPLQQDFTTEDEKRRRIRAWGTEHVEVQTLRQDGLWSNLHDRTLEGGAYFRAAEHSAQQSGNKLKEYEALFKEGRINLLSCSTTMEMGVDIGGIAVVAMNNVPPHPANYLQRAGRAGRRAETRSIALSLCKNNPHDQNVFRDTLWAFKTKLPAPCVSLNSRNIIQRHINAMLLSAFLQKKRDRTSAEKLNMEWWLLPKEEPTKTYSAQCRSWVERLDWDGQKERRLESGLRSLLSHSPFEGAPLTPFCKNAAEMLKKQARAWYAEYDIIKEELDRFNTAEARKEPAFHALDRQRKRLTDEYLLRELASVGFLPGYGFPTDIASFNNLTLDDLNRRRATREDNRYQRRELPSRDAATALREYAPGAEIVVDGLVYQSAGVTLNWHRPAGAANINEVQNLRRAWRCPACGSNGTTVRAGQMTGCPDCGKSFEQYQGNKNLFEYLEPAGYAVDVYSHPHNDVSVQKYIPVAPPWVNAGGAWLSLPNPTLGWHRSSTDGTVFHYTAGEHDKGFALCLFCGRVEPMNNDGKLPAVFCDPKTGNPKPHNRLQGRDADRECQRSDFAIQPNLRLGYEARTDVLEIFLLGLDGVPITDRTTAFSLAVAIRNAIAQLLGIEQDELGCDTKSVRLVGKNSGQAIVIFDKHASGYSSSISGRLTEILRLARESLQCKAECQDACQTCLLDFETRFQRDNLNRHETLKFLTPEWLDRLKLPQNREYWGQDSVAEHQTLLEAITRELAVSGNRTVTIFLSGDADDWDVPSSPLRKYAQQWAASEYQVRLVMSQHNSAHISEPDAKILNALAQLGDVSLWTGKPPTAQHGATVLAAVGHDKATVWASDTPTIGLPDAHWGDNEGAMIVRGCVAGSVTSLEPLTLISPSQETTSCPLEITTQLNGPSKHFGKHLLKEIENIFGKPLVDEGDAVVELAYCDRYLNSPFPLALLLNFFNELRRKYKKYWTAETLTLTVASTCGQVGSLSPPNRVWHDWLDAEQRNNAIRAACQHEKWDVTLLTPEKRQVPHSRLLNIRLQSGNSIRIWFDQGFGYWKKAPHGVGDVSFPFSAPLPEQTKKIVSMNVAIESQDFPTMIFIAN